MGWGMDLSELRKWLMAFHISKGWNWSYYSISENVRVMFETKKTN
jgi:hypothetical protein